MKDPSIKRQLLAAVFVTSIVVLLLSCLFLISHELASYKRTMERDLKTLAQVIAGNSSAIMMINDEKAAREVPRELESPA